MNIKQWQKSCFWKRKLRKILKQSSAKCTGTLQLCYQQKYWITEFKPVDINIVHENCRGYRFRNDWKNPWDPDKWLKSLGKWDCWACAGYFNERKKLILHMKAFLFFIMQPSYERTRCRNEETNLEVLQDAGLLVALVTGNQNPRRPVIHRVLLERTFRGGARGFHVPLQNCND